MRGPETVNSEFGFPLTREKVGTVVDGSSAMASPHISHLFSLGEIFEFLETEQARADR